MEPAFTFEARIRPWELPRLSLDQIGAHLLWWAKANDAPITADEQLMAQHPSVRGGRRGGS